MGLYLLFLYVYLNYISTAYFILRMQMSKKVRILGNGNAIMLNPYTYILWSYTELACKSLYCLFLSFQIPHLYWHSLIGRGIIGLVFITSFEKQMVWEVNSLSYNYIYWLGCSSVGQVLQELRLIFGHPSLRTTHCWAYLDHLLLGQLRFRRRSRDISILINCFYLWYHQLLLPVSQPLH